MAQVPTPPASRHASEAPEVQQKDAKEVDNTSDGLLQTLDTLLERYLHLLDQYQKLQADLAKRLSSGFLSLAQANYTCAPGRRYGADYYDERMKATWKVSLRTSHSDTDETADNTSSPLRNPLTIESMSDKEQIEEKEEKTPGDRPQNATPPPDDDSKDENENTTQTVDSSDLPEQAEINKPRKPKQPKKFRSSDPITWYGILVPPALRSAQKSFTEAVDDHVAELASVIVEMRAMENEVEKVRRQVESV